MGAGRKIKCLKCNDIIQSMYRHNFKRCKCGAVAVDGGSDYLRTLGNIEDLAEQQENGVFKSYTEMMAELKEDREGVSDWDDTLMDGLSDWEAWEDEPVGFIGEWDPKNSDKL